MAFQRSKNYSFQNSLGSSRFDLAHEGRSAAVLVEPSGFGRYANQRNELPQNDGRQDAARSVDRTSVGLEPQSTLDRSGGHTVRGIEEGTDTDDDGTGVVALPAVVASIGDDGRDDPVPVTPPEDVDPDPAPPVIDQEEPPEAPEESGRSGGAIPGQPQDLPAAPAPSNDNADFGRAAGDVPDIPPVSGPVTGYVSGGPSESAYNVAIEFVGTWTVALQSAFTDAADYLSTLILADLPDAVVDDVAIDDISISATLEQIDGVGGVLGSAGPRDLRFDGSFLPSTGAMTFDSADAQNQLEIGNWETIVLHEMMHALGFGTLWGSMGLTSGSVNGGDIRFTGVNATDTYQTEFANIAGSDPDSLLGVPVETDGGPGTAGGHWDEFLFNDEIMTGFVDTGSFVSVMTIAAFEDMGYDTVFDDPNSPIDLAGPLPVDPLLDLFG